MIARALKTAGGSLVLLAFLGCGGGSSTNSNQAPPPPTPALPTISSFSPASGAVGAAITITGTNFTGARSVVVAGKAATFTVTSATQIATSVPAGAVTGKITVTTPGGTATSTTNFTVNLPPPTIASFSPTSGPIGANVGITGTGFTGATAVKFNGSSASFSVTDDSHVSATVPNSATSGTISVTTPSGTTTSSTSFTVNVPTGLDLTIDGLYVTQATQNYPGHDVPLVQGRSAWVRVFVLANQANTAAPQVRVRFINGATTNTLTINAPGTSTPLSADTESATSSWNAAVPAAWITPGTQVIADVDPANAIAEANKGNNQATQNLNVQTLKTWKITLIPVKTADGRVGVVENANRTRTQLVEFAKRVWPVPDTVDVSVGAQMVSSATNLTSTGTGWGTVLNELQAKRVADGVTDRYYFGFVNVSYTSGVAGLGFVGAPEAIGWDLSSADQVLAHEEGHNFGRQHSPCGGVANPDPNYPYAGGLIGVPGWDAFTASGNLKTSADHHDVMTYCSNLWVSDYTYKGVLSFRLTSPLGVVVSAHTQAKATPKEGLLVWGRLVDGKMILEPAFRVPLTGENVEPGSYVWEARDGAGQLLASVPFHPTKVEDLPFASEEHFAFVVPLESAVMDAIWASRVMKDGLELARRTALSPERSDSALKSLRVQNLLGRDLLVQWDANANPVLMLRNSLTGEVSGFLRGGYAEIEDAPEQLEIHVSDGVRSTLIARGRLD
jgi:IPT/TIG domain